MLLFVLFHFTYTTPRPLLSSSVIMKQNITTRVLQFALVSVLLSFVLTIQLSVVVLAAVVALPFANSVAAVAACWNIWINCLRIGMH